MSQEEQHAEVSADIDLVGIAATQAVQGEKIGNIETACNDIKICLMGNNEQVGLVTRTDRLEQKELFKSKLFWIVITIGVGLVSTEVLTLLAAK